MIRVSPSSVEDFARANSSILPPEFVSGIALAEVRGGSIDAEGITREPNGTDSIGVCQVNAGEATSVGYDGADLTDPETNVIVFCLLMERNLAVIEMKAGLSTPLPKDVWYYLAWSHNQGIGAVEKSIAAYSLDWTVFVERNARDNQSNYVNERLVPYATRAAQNCPGELIASSVIGTVMADGPPSGATIPVVVGGLLILLAMGVHNGTR